MNVQLGVQFRPPTEENWQAMRSVAGQLTDDPSSVRVYGSPGEPEWLTAEFTMPREWQDAAVDRIDRVLRFSLDNRCDSIIRFPRSAAEQARAERKNEQSRARRRTVMVVE